MARPMLPLPVTMIVAGLPGTLAVRKGPSLRCCITQPEEIAMRKLQLDLESLEVASFATAPEVARRGTVHGQNGAAPNEYEEAITDLSACSWTNGAFACKTCGPCCTV